jgi:hypothetical protein
MDAVENRRKEKNLSLLLGIELGLRAVGTVT